MRWRFFIYHPDDTRGMRYQLMHRDIHVCDMTVRGSGVVPDPDRIMCPEHMPYGTTLCGGLDADAFRRWWSSRLIPPTREGQDIMLDRLMADKAEPLAVAGSAVGLTDSYWVRPEGDGSKWLHTEVFHNRFDPVIGDMLMGRYIRNIPDTVRSPDLVTGGKMRKRWLTVDGRRGLVKTASGDDARMVLNEIVASVIADAVGVPHVDYRYMEHMGAHCCVCKGFVVGPEEFVSAEMFRETGGQHWYRDYTSTCRMMGLDVVPFLDGMIVLDFIIAHDRARRDYGIIRNPDDLKWLRPAPVFDNADCLGVGPTEHCPFADDPYGQLDLVSSWEPFDPDAIGDAVSVAEDMISGCGWVGNDAKAEMMSILEERVEGLKGHISRNG